MRKIKFVPGEYYHLFNRGVDGRKAFLDEADFKRALVSLVVFNDLETPPRNLTRFVKEPTRLLEQYRPDNRERLVDFIVFTFLPNQYHFFVRELVKNGISRLMHRFDKGYSRYFNLKNERTGSLWQATFGARHITDQAHFVHIISYIHLNILDLYFPGWREGKIENWSKAAGKLASYLWSSYHFYRTGTSPIPFMDLILSKPEWLAEYYPEPKVFEENLRAWSVRSLPDQFSYS